MKNELTKPHILLKWTFKNIKINAFNIGALKQHSIIKECIINNINVNTRIQKLDNVFF